ncbi:hypothetical protein, partial [Peribacillus simplex]|uniref:hypothetical protein n=1 Tax=Peribacillus simplex TaxID=1478 RepID=UPI001C87B811
PNLSELISFTRKSNYKGYEILRISEHSRDIRIKLREFNKRKNIIGTAWCSTTKQENYHGNRKDRIHLPLLY